jgi:hypothetical protein
MNGVDSPCATPAAAVIEHAVAAAVTGAAESEQGPWAQRCSGQHTGEFVHEQLDSSAR